MTTAPWSKMLKEEQIMKKNYMLPQIDVCMIHEEDIITTSLTVNMSFVPNIGEDDCVDFEQA